MYQLLSSSIATDRKASIKKKKLDYMYNNVEIDSNFVSRFYQECFQDTKNWDSGVQCCVGPTSNRLSTPSETFIHHLK